VAQGKIELFGIPGIPLIGSESDLPKLIVKSVKNAGISIKDGDILVIAHAIVSKAEGRVVHRSEVSTSAKAQQIAEKNGFDPIQVELALREAKEVLREERVLITVTHSGLVCNFSGVDKSNAPEDSYILLPLDPDESARRIRAALESLVDAKLAVIISDTQGRPWRTGGVNLAIGSAGIGAFAHNKGKKDLYDRELERSTVCQVDEIASAAEPLMGQAGEGIPLVLVRGFRFSDGLENASDIQRPVDEDLFR
jgi:coenzyme F420-0:L-glutamate ligase/coenzyme F420-1:gamma-L-glutamate ligase